MYKFPVLSSQLKKQKKFINPFQIERIVKERQEIPQSASVVNLSLSGSDYY